MNTIDEMIEVLQAHKEGKRITRQDRVTGTITTHTETARPFDFSCYIYKVSEEKKKVKMWKFYYKSSYGNMLSTTAFYSSLKQAEEDVRKRILGPILGTEIEVEE